MLLLLLWLLMSAVGYHCSSDNRRDLSTPPPKSVLSDQTDESLAPPPLEVAPVDVIDSVVDFLGVACRNGPDEELDPDKASPFDYPACLPCMGYVIPALEDRLRVQPELSSSIFVSALLYLDRLNALQGITVTKSNVYNLFTTALLIAAKFHHDISNKEFAHVIGMRLSELNRMEEEMLFGLEFELFISQQRFEGFEAKVRRWGEERNIRVRRQEESEWAQCSICLTEEIAHAMTYTKCRHNFHFGCLSKWVWEDSNLHCPMCRVPFF